MAQRRLGQILVDLGYLTEDQLWDVLEEQKQSPGEIIGQVAIRMGLVTEAQVTEALAEQWGMPVINLAETLRNELSARGVAVSVINPGYVETPMTSANKFPMPFIISSEDAAKRIIGGLEKGKFEIAFPWQLVALMKLGRLMPNRLFFWYARTLLAPPRKRP